MMQLHDWIASTDDARFCVGCGVCLWENPGVSVAPLQQMPGIGLQLEFRCDCGRVTRPFYTLSALRVFARVRTEAAARRIPFTRTP